jgi:multidrug efflux pump subunit AcrB
MLGGVFAYLCLPVSSQPQVDFHKMQATKQLPGARPDAMASPDATPLERNFGQIPLPQLMKSSSLFGVSQIALQFDLKRDIDAAARLERAAMHPDRPCRKSCLIRRSAPR